MLVFLKVKWSMCILVVVKTKTVVGLNRHLNY